MSQSEGGRALSEFMMTVEIILGVKGVCCSLPLVYKRANLQYQSGMSSSEIATCGRSFHYY